MQNNCNLCSLMRSRIKRRDLEIESLKRHIQLLEEHVADLEVGIEENENRNEEMP